MAVERRRARVAGPSASETRNHWREDKIGLLMTMTSEESATDPCPTIPETFVNPLRIIKLARELQKGCAPGEDAVADPAEPEAGSPLECPEYTPPTVRVKSMVATRQGAESFGKILAAAARSRGFYGARRKAFVADGAECELDDSEAVVQRFRADHGFHPRVIVCVRRGDGGSRPFAAGWEVYVRWIGWVWQGRRRGGDRGVGAAAGGNGAAGRRRVGDQPASGWWPRRWDI